LLERVASNRAAHDYRFPGGGPQDISHLSLADQINVEIAKRSLTFKDSGEFMEATSQTDARFRFEVAFGRERCVIMKAYRGDSDLHANQVIEAMLQKKLELDVTFARTVERPKTIVLETIENPDTVKYLESIYNKSSKQLLTTNDKALQGFLENTPLGKMCKRISSRFQLMEDQIFIEYLSEDEDSAPRFYLAITNIPAP